MLAATRTFRAASRAPAVARRMSTVNMITSEEAFAEAVAKPSLSVVYYTATWCGPCQRIAPLYTKLAEENPAVAFVSERAHAILELRLRMPRPAVGTHVTAPCADCLVAEVDVDDMADIAAQAGVTAMPTFHCGTASSLEQFRSPIRAPLARWHRFRARKCCAACAQS
jgi:thiol-disulfide isomerase/thioredoxin